ncbi:MAG TPA: hypothetical protein ENK91_09300 [Bacteroidetes bacterium]|nr:hypothetical protein [Bacteroidota bacterium]
MNRFNDIINEDKILELPVFLDNYSDYRSIIKDAFELTDGLLRLDDFEIEEDERHLKIKIISKNTQTNFKLEILKNKLIDQNNLIRGLNRALTDIFYLGDERFYPINGKVVPKGLGFISNRQKRHLAKAGLIGESKIFVNQDKQVKSPSKPDIQQGKTTQQNVTKTDNDIRRPITRPKSSNDFSDKLKYLELKLRKKNNLEIFNIIHYPDEQNYEIYEIAKRIAKERNIPIFTKKEYSILMQHYSAIIEEIVKLSYKKNKKVTVHQILTNNNLDDNIKYIVLNEAQRKIKKGPIPWKTIISIILFIIGLLLFLSRL